MAYNSNIPLFQQFLKKVSKMSKSQITVQIEICSNCQSHQWCTRHNQASYSALAMEIKRALQQQDSNIVVSIFQVGGQKMGSFQIICNGVVLFSKLNLGYFPHTPSVVARVMSFIQDSRNNRDLTKYSQKKSTSPHQTAQSSGGSFHQVSPKRNSKKSPQRTKFDPNQENSAQKQQQGGQKINNNKAQQSKKQEHKKEEQKKQEPKKTEQHKKQQHKKIEQHKKQEPKKTQQHKKQETKKTEQHKKEEHHEQQKREEKKKTEQHKKQQLKKTEQHKKEEKKKTEQHKKEDHKKEDHHEQPKKQNKKSTEQNDEKKKTQQSKQHDEHKKNQEHHKSGNKKEDVEFILKQTEGDKSVPIKQSQKKQQLVKQKLKAQDNDSIQNQTDRKQQNSKDSNHGAQNAVISEAKPSATTQQHNIQSSKKQEEYGEDFEHEAKKDQTHQTPVQ